MQTCMGAKRNIHVGLLTLSLLSVWSAAAAEQLDRVLAVVSGNLILMSDVTAAREFGLVPVPVGTSDPTRFVLSRLIDRELILAEVERYAPPEPAADAVDRAVTVIRQRFGDATAFETALRTIGIDQRRLRQITAQELSIRAYLDQRFTVPQPTDDDLQRFYRDHPERFVRDGRPLAFDAAKADVIEALATERRTAMIDDWLAGLRRRAEISDLYVTGQ